METNHVVSNVQISSRIPFTGYARTATNGVFVALSASGPDCSSLPVCSGAPYQEAEPWPRAPALGARPDPSADQGEGLHNVNDARQ